ncbi:hypothetical protein K1T71_010845 [Dendrolimus kikuchii]|uniref:Uncharacterized protein n=1 Tax=Dendrolimus kikuchii TaxID=765133 RepID=A0ACC1CQ82_9NEOP|nr:hypothetical protein K1T71_010845 [Dendrolimus kikuchii]
MFRPRYFLRRIQPTSMPPTSYLNAFRPSNRQPSIPNQQEAYGSRMESRE